MKYIFLIQIVFMLVMLSGWIQSIYKLTQCDFEHSYKAEIIYGVGCIPPIGMVVGWFNIEDVATAVE